MIPISDGNVLTCNASGGAKNKTILEDCDIYVVRIAPARFNNCLKLSKPCEKCTKFINKYNIRCTYYSTNYEYEYMCS